MTATLRLAEELISRRTLTPQDAGCQALITQRLEKLGFVCETLVSGPPEARVTNLWANYKGFSALARVEPAGNATDEIAPQNAFKTLVFAGHTDVVPTGALAQWHSDPFTPSHRDGKLYGRGASDMKTSLAAFVVAIETFLAAHQQNGTQPALNIGLLLTSDEEGPAIDGTAVVCRWLQARGQVIDYCIVGEPTSVERTGDMIKNGRRGSLTGKLTVKGVQGHIAYPQLARNPVHLLAPALAALAAEVWDAGNDFFQPTGWQVSNIHAGTGAGNVIPGEVVVDFNFRFSTASTAEGLQQRVQALLAGCGLVPGQDYDCQWTLGALPFLTPPGHLVDVVRRAIAEVTGIRTELSTTGGTSDARFMATVCPQVIELGPPNASIHQINEHIALADIEPLTAIYRRVLELLDAPVQQPVSA
ncbi:MAG: succinyl-diaminopimelate desuccinylase [Burkholderiaceae bacterium]